MKHIRLWETWQWIQKGGEDQDSERNYKSTLKELLDWAYGPDWINDWAALEALPLSVNGDQIEDDGEFLGYHETLKRAAGTKIGIWAEYEEDWGISVIWYLGGDEYEIITQDWPFESDDVTDEEAALVRKISALPAAQELDGPTIIDFVQWAIREQGMQPQQVSGDLLGQCLGQRRIGLN
jgi:hypothetical protein